MGNAESTIHYPSSLSATVSYCESGKFDYPSTTMLHFEKSTGAAVGCGGNVVFKKNVKSSSYTYKITKANSFKCEVGEEITVENCKGTADAEASLAIKLGMSCEEVREVAILIETKINDDAMYSELYIYVNYTGGREGHTVEWKKNDLKLTTKKRWNDRSDHLTVDVGYKRE